MELSWSSFILELINFIVLIWILKHFFYAPIKNTIISRKIEIQHNLDQAKSLQDQAYQLQSKYESRLKDWETEKTQKQITFQQETEKWKENELIKFEKSLDIEREKMSSREKQRVDAIIDMNAKKAMELSTKFATKLLVNFADANLEGKIIIRMIEDLSRLSLEKTQLLKENIKDNPEVHIQSAYSISEMQKEQFSNTLKNVIGEHIKTIYSEDLNLIAGLNIKIGAIILQANLRDELKFFADIEKDHDCG